MRLMLALVGLVVVGVCRSTSAAPITFTLAAGGGSGAPPQPITFQLRPLDNVGTPYTITVPNVTPADVGMTWTIDAGNAASYGLADWAAFAAAPNDPNWRGTWLGLAPTLAPGQLDAGLLPGETLTSFTISRVEIELTEYRSNPSRPTGGDVTARVVGDGVLVPEPGAWLIAVSAGVALRRRV